MDEIITIYEQIFGSPGDVDQFGVSENLFPGNFTNKEQDVTLLPRNLKTGPDNPETELAYITDDEKALLALMNPGTPHEGPEGVPTYDVDDYVESGWGFLNDSPASSSASSNDSSGSYAYGDNVSGVDIWIPSSASSSESDDVSGLDFLTNYPDQSPPASNNGSNNGSNDGSDDEDNNILNTALNAIGFPGSLTLKGVDALSDFLRNNKIENVKDFIKDPDASAGWASMVDKWDEAGLTDKEKNKAMQSWLTDYDNAWKDTLFDELKDDPGMEDIEKTSFDEVLDFYKTKHGGSEEWKKRFSGGKGEHAEWWIKNIPQTTGQAGSMVSNLTMADIEKAKNSGTINAGEARRLSYELQQARDIVSEKDDRQKAMRSDDGRGGAPVEKIIEEDEVVTTTTDPRAGAFNVGGTMPYTHDVATGGVETDVPLGRRFEIDKAGKYRGTTGGMDLNEAMQYATLGGYGQLEPFQQYLARRRKYLDEDEPQYFDEDGNVIYSGVT